jgi:hypothetical protein
MTSTTAPQPTSHTVDDKATNSSYTVYRLGVDWAASGDVWKHGTYAIRFDLVEAMQAARFPERVQRRIREVVR